MISEKNAVCVKCGHSWKKRTENPQECPSCKCRNWKAKEVVELVLLENEEKKEAKKE